MGQVLARQRKLRLLLLVALFIFAGPLPATSVRLDAATVTRGYRLDSLGGTFRLHLPAGAVPPETTVDLTSESPESYEVPVGQRIASDVVTVVVTLPESSSLHPPLWVEFTYPSSAVGQKVIAAYHREQQRWQPLPVRRDWRENRIRAAIPWTFGRFALLETSTVREIGDASWYRHRGCRCTASPDYPTGTTLKVTSRETGAAVTVRVNDYGPDRSIFPTRILDLDREAFRLLKSPRHGIVPVIVEAPL